MGTRQETSWANFEIAQSANGSAALNQINWPLFDPKSEQARRFKRLHRPTEEIDRQITTAYQKYRMGDRSALAFLSAKLKWPRYAICKRGAELGLARTKEHSWTCAEESVLIKFGHLSWTGIQKKLSDAGYKRTVAAISLKSIRLKVKQNLDGYSANSLALGFGVDVHKILTWIQRGLLHAERRGTARTKEQGGDTWWIERRQVKSFVLRNPEEVDLTRVEKFWFLDLITNGRICR